MLGIMMDGMCKGCEYADLELTYILKDREKKVWLVGCKHNNACCDMESKTIDRLTKELRGEEE